MTPVTILIGGHHECSLLGLQTFLASRPGMQVTGITRNYTELVQLADTRQPFILITDVAMPVLNGAEGVRQLVQQYPLMNIIACNGYEQPKIARQLIDAGVQGCISKQAPLEEVAWAVQTIADGDTYCCSITQQQLKSLEAKDCPFTRTQLELLPHICMGKTNEQIADELYKSNRTIEMHRRYIKQKLGAKRLADVITYAIAHGYYMMSLLTGMLMLLPSDILELDITEMM